jgi:DNA mismatch repair protein MutL
MSSLLPLHIHKPRKIRQLSVQLANQIAAGEVIERPASVVKELLENSIDAGSSQIDIVIERGGIQLIQVSDNGHGIATDELVLALAPHATSKIYTLEELNQVLSLGFRGEALASIASVSRVTLQSRQAESSMGWMVAEPLTEPQPCAMPSGSRIAVRELFFNTPGRKRFLRTERTEFLQIEAMIRRLALSHFEIGFSLEHNGKRLFHLPAAITEVQRLQRIGQLFGKAFVDASLQINFAAAGMVLSGWIGAPDYSISQSDRQYFFLNGRGMRDKVINHAIRHVYQGYTPEGRSPCYLLNLQIAPEQVDVNVHPTKHEVRFRQGRMVHDFLTTSLMRAFEEVGMSVSQGSSPKPVEGGRLYNMAGSGAQRIGESAAVYQAVAGAVGPATVSRSGTDNFSLLASRFLLFMADGEHYLCDLLSLYQRAIEEAFTQLGTREVAELASQPLLFPEMITLSPQRLKELEGELADFQRLGITLEAHGEDRLLLRSLPRLLGGATQQQLIHVLLKQGDPTVLIDRLHQLLRQSAAKAVAAIEGDQFLEEHWLKGLGLSRVGDLLALKETIRLDSKGLERLFS